MNETAVAEKELALNGGAGLPILSFSREQVELIKRTVAKGATDDELALFLYTCKRTGLDPLVKQIHAVKRYDTKLEKEVMAIQTGIDGYRLIAERTRLYAPGHEPLFTYQKEHVISATAYVKKKTEDGVWHEIAATAFFSEYVQLKKDGTPNGMWAKMPHNQLAKCAEALALRRAFPAETSGVYTTEEMGQAENPIETAITTPQATATRNDALTMQFIPMEVKQNSGEKNGKPWVQYGIKDIDGHWYSTFSELYGELASQAKDDKSDVVLTYKINGQYRNIETLKRP